MVCCIEIDVVFYNHILRLVRMVQYFIVIRGNAIVVCL
jgi:hypothetical protein